MTHIYILECECNIATHDQYSVKVYLFIYIPTDFFISIMVYYM